ncbi:amino acid adenylation domain-containing protein [Noviherbaspirillum sp. CPCC 100848]|uniref:Amino acid adenylation domain-containing protein n=1 Tax=Noviherbaspirillum album TaxID=3080276 RepID=A0ABU6JAM3_9BURK|nr:non-ribosomal peptide synthetase [Noviherbaspirillum sp. CPCC 100848]MEC4720698.1 amino acid adenylation domain-containing protein [Noviherbaspirillum sp. CPCC 100848]
MIDRRNISNLYPLSSLQEGMLYHALREPESRAYFEQIDFEVPGKLSAAAYRQAWEDLVARHDILRTVFAVRKLPQPLQIVLRQAPLALTEEDLSALAPELAEARITAYRNEDLARGFDLTAAVPMRLGLFTLAGGRHRAVWSFHHILLDGWSLAILQSDLDALYAARIAGRSAALPPPAPFSAYIKWLGGRDRKQGLAYWQTRLQGLSFPTPVPRRIDSRFGSSTAGHVVGEIRHPLAADAAQALPRLAAAHGVTVNIVVQCLWGMLLCRLNGQRDAAFAATVSGRPPELPDAARTVGIFINAVPVRVRLQGDESFAGLLACLHAESIESQPYHDCPLPEVQAEHPLRDALFDHILVFENYPQDEKASQPSAPDAVHLHEYTHYNFEFQFLPGDPPVLRMRFNQNLFDPASIAVIAGQFEDMLLSAAADPQRSAQQIALPAPKWQAPATLAIAASFTAEPIAETLRWWLAQFACASEVRLAPYNQCLTQLGDAQSVLSQADLGVLLLRFEDAARDLDGLSTAEACASLDAQYDALHSLLERRQGNPLIVALLPCNPQGALADKLLSLEQRWAAAMLALPGVVPLDLRRLAGRFGLDEVFDPEADHIGHMPYSAQAFDAVAAGIARAVMARARAPFKVIAVDCDNTLWSGVVGEAGPLGVHVGAGHLALQQFLLERMQEGFLITLASKNREEDVWAVLDQHPDMLLRREHIAAAAINWQPKSGNLRQLASRLNLGVDSFIFLDDSPVECSEVMQNCPEALAIPMPSDPALFESWLAHVWAFDVTAVTAEDRERTGMMQAESRRQALLGETDPQSFLEQLQLTVKVGPAQRHQIARVAQLTQRTNQFNLSGKRRSEEDIAQLIADPETSVMAVEVEDRFGAYGLTGVIIVRKAAGTLAIDTLLLSCRVLGRKVEHALLGALARQALQAGCGEVRALLVPTERNEPVRIFLRQPPWEAAGENLFICKAAAGAAEVPGVEVIDNFQFAPSQTDANASAQEPAPSATSAPAAQVPDSAAIRTQWPEFPVPVRNEAQLRHAFQYLPLLAACAGWPHARLRHASRTTSRPAGRMPASGSEAAVAAIWSEVLGREVADAEAAFIDLGGHSLHAVRAVSRLGRAFNRELGLSQFFALGSIAKIAAWLDSQPAANTQAATTGASIPLAPDAPSYPLSHNQQRLWILSRLGAAANTYNLCAAFTLRGGLNLPALRHAVGELLERHEALRTVFRLEGEQPRQVIVAAHEASFSVISHTAGKGSEETNAAIRAHITSRSRTPFDLEHGPLFRMELHATDTDEQVLAIYLHHIIGDGWSFSLLLDDLANAYARHAGKVNTKTDSKTTTPVLRYRDFAVWNRSHEYEKALVRQRDYWLRQLQPLVPIAQFPMDFPRPAVPGNEGASLECVLPMPLKQLKAWAAERHVSLFPLLASLVTVVMYRCGGETTVRLGMPVAGRDRPELEQTVGFFANTTVVSAQLAADQTFLDVITTLQQQVTGAIENQAYSFDRLVSELKPEREPGRNPLFDAMVVLQNPRDGAGKLPGIEVTDFEMDSGLAAFDLVFEFAERNENELACALRYRKDLYRDDTAQLLLQRVTSLLASALAAPDTAIHRLGMHGTSERARLDAFADGGKRALPAITLPELFSRQAAATPAAPALVSGGLRLDYRTLDRRANAIARHLRLELGIADGDTVAVMLERHADWPIAMLGAMKAGAVYLPLDLRHPAARRRELLRQSGAKVLIAATDDLAPFDDLEGLHRMAPLRTGPDLDIESEHAPAAGSNPDDAAYLIFTSGSTGKPKGVKVHHRAFINMILEQVRGFALREDDVVMHVASCAFDASLSEFFMAWACGGAVVIADNDTVRDSKLLAGCIARHGATVATFTPSHLRQLADRDLSGLRKIILAAEPVLGRDARRLKSLGIECFNAYGPTETAVCATLGRIDKFPEDAMPVPIGRPLANLTLRIIDSHGGDAPLGTPGELTILGEGVALGYLNASQDAGSAFFTLAGGMRGYRTGDIVRWLPDGQLEYLGRKDAQVKIRGHRVEPAEIAAALSALEDVRQAEVVVEGDETVKFLTAYLCGRPQTDARLRAVLAERLPAHMIPARFVWLESMPLTTSGKLDRSALPALAVARSADPDDRAAPAESASLTATESKLLRLWRELLPGSVDADTDFFLAGGNSLLAMTGARRIEAEMGIACPALQFFRTPTVRDMAAALDSSANTKLLQHFGNGEVQILALPPHPGMDLGYAALSRALPEATIHAARFVDKPVSDLVEDYRLAYDDMNICDGALLIGYSAGGMLALALAAALEASGRRPRAVILLDTWDLSKASAAVRAGIDADMAAFASGNDREGNGYRARMSSFAPRGPVAAPVHHLLAATGGAQAPDGVTRDWKHLANTDYKTYAMQGRHHELLDDAHVGATAGCLREIMRQLPPAEFNYKTS